MEKFEIEAKFQTVGYRSMAHLRHVAYRRAGDPRARHAGRPAQGAHLAGGQLVLAHDGLEDGGLTAAARTQQAVAAGRRGGSHSR